MYISELPEKAPSRGNWFSQSLGRLILRLGGWEYKGEWPDVPQCAIIIAPHTSNWDFIVGLSAAFACRLSPRWLGKDALFKSALGWFFHWQGGLPVERNHPHGMVGSVVDTVKKTPKIWLVLAPEGTRSKVKKWRTGFYHIAHNAGIPIVPVAFDWKNKKIHVLELYYPTGDFEKELPEIQALFNFAEGYDNKNA